MNLFSIWLKELKSFFQYDAKNWTFLVFQYDSKNWTFFFKNVQGIEPLFHMNYFFTWLELNSFSINTTQREEFFTKNDSKCWTLLFNMSQRIFFWLTQKKIEPCVKRKVSKSGLFFFWFWSKELFLFSTWLEELNLFSICLNELNLFLEYDPQNWTFFQYDWKNSELFKKSDSLNWTFLAKMTQRMFCKKVKKWLNELNLSVIRLTELNFFLIRLKELNHL